MAKIEIKKLAEQNGLNLSNLFRLISKDKSIKTYGFSNNMVDESDVEFIILQYEAAYPEEIAARNQKQAEETAREQAKERAREEAEQKQKEIDSHFAENYRKMIISSCATVDGYKAVEQLGLVFGECLYAASGIKKLAANIYYNYDESSFKGVELGATEIIEQARDYAIKKMKTAAANRGANAILGIDAESTLTGDIMHVTIYGTAVVLERI